MPSGSSCKIDNCQCDERQQQQQQHQQQQQQQQQLQLQQQQQQQYQHQLYHQCNNNQRQQQQHINHSTHFYHRMGCGTRCGGNELVLYPTTTTIPNNYYNETTFTTDFCNKCDNNREQQIICRNEKCFCEFCIRRSERNYQRKSIGGEIGEGYITTTTSGAINSNYESPTTCGGNVIMQNGNYNLKHSTASAASVLSPAAAPCEIFKYKRKQSIVYVKEVAIQTSIDDDDLNNLNTLTRATTTATTITTSTTNDNIAGNNEENIELSTLSPASPDSDIKKYHQHSIEFTNTSTLPTSPSYYDSSILCSRYIDKGCDSIDESPPPLPPISCQCKTTNQSVGHRLSKGICIDEESNKVYESDATSYTNNNTRFTRLKEPFWRTKPLITKQKSIAITKQHYEDDDENDCGNTTIHHNEQYEPLLGVEIDGGGNNNGLRKCINEQCPCDIRHHHQYHDFPSPLKDEDKEDLIEPTPIIKLEQKQKQQHQQQQQQIQQQIQNSECVNDICECKLGYNHQHINGICIKPKRPSSRINVLKIITFALIGSAALITGAAIRNQGSEG